jgi:hypothetical protein
MTLVSQWDGIFDVPCPITFSVEDLERHAKETENMDEISQILQLFRDQRILPADGLVDHEDWEMVLQNRIEFKETFLNAAENEEERELYDKLWPYEDQDDSV